MKKSLGMFNKVYAMQLATIFIGFVIFGFSENIKGPAMPRIQFDFMLNESQLGTLLSLNALGYLIACSFTAYLTKIWGIKWVTVAAFASMAVSGILIYFSHFYTLFSASYFLMYRQWDVGDWPGYSKRSDFREKHGHDDEYDAWLLRLKFNGRSTYRNWPYESDDCRPHTGLARDVPGDAAIVCDPDYDCVVQYIPSR